LSIDRCGEERGLGKGEGGETAKELAGLVEHGMSPLEAIRAATLVGARVLGVEDRGTIEAGKLADVIAVPGNPLEDVAFLQDVRFVMKGGEVYRSPGEGDRPGRLPP
jgi:imidazolonepropionase-like amidohydrolase